MMTEEINYNILKRDFTIINIISGFALAVTGVIILFQQLDILPSMPCVFHDLTHLYCPGCGGTRAVKALLKGHLLKSIYYNPSFILGVLLILYYEVGVFITLIKKNGKRYYYAKAIPVYIYLAFLILFAVVRDCLLVYGHIDMLHDFY